MRHRPERTVPFVKVEATGNDFVLINALDRPESNWVTLAVRMSARRFGAGSDGLLVLLPSSRADFRVRMFNPDGSEDACGNGLRCAAVYVQAAGLSAGSSFVFEAMDGLREAEITRTSGGLPGVRVNMGSPSLRAADIPANVDVDEVTDYPLRVGENTYRITCVLVGTPHAVIRAPSESFWDAIPPVSAAIETLPIFPERISVTWCSCESPESLVIRTWERGVGPTLSCGTGACSALVAANLRAVVGTRASVTSPGGALEVEWPNRGNIFMTGPANIVFEGEWPLA